MRLRTLFFSLLTITSVATIAFLIWGVVTEFDGNKKVKVIKKTSEKAKVSDYRAVIPLHYYYRHLRYIDGKVNGIPCKFLFTTGGGETILSDKLFSVESRRALADTVKGISINKQTKLYGKKAGVNVEIGNLTLKHDYVLVKDIMKDLPKGMPEIDGIISTKAFKDVLLTVDWKGRKLIIENESSFNTLTAQALSLDLKYIKASHDVGLSLLTKMSTPEGQLWFELDNGKNKSVLNAKQSSYILRNSHDYAHLDHPEKYTVTSVKLLNLCTAPLKMPVNVAYETLGDGILGASFFREWILTFDLEKGQLYCRPQPNSRICT